MENQDKRLLRHLLSKSRPHSSAGLTEQLFALIEQLRPKVIASYVPMQSEPDVSEFNSLASKSFQLLLPRIVGEDLEFANGQLRSGSFGILEPQGQAVPAGNIDLMILPALAVDKSGNRLGKGKGFYDRALKKFEGKSAAVIFETELLESVPCEAHDMRVSTVVTPLRYLTFS